MQLFILLFIEGGSYVHVSTEGQVSLSDRKTKMLGSSSPYSNEESGLTATFTPITLSVTSRCTPFGHTRTRSACGLASL